MAILGAALFGLREIRRQMATPIVMDDVASTVEPPASFVTTDGPRARVLYDLRRHPVPGIQLRPAHLQPVSGWSGSEAWGTWSLGPESVLGLTLDRTADRVLVINPRRHDDVFDRPQVIEVLANGTSLGTLTLHHAMPVFTLAWPSHAQVAGRNLLTIRVERTMSPQRAGIGRDPRELGMGLRSLAILEDNGGWLPSALRGGDLVRTPPDPAAELATDDDAAIVVTAPGDVVWWLDRTSPAEQTVTVAPASTRAAFSVLTTDGATTRVSSRRTENGTTTVHDRFAADGGSPEVSGAFLVARIEDASQTTPVTLRRSAPQPPRGVWTAHGTNAPHANIVVVILDAARPDRFGCYGGPRPTSPFIDALASQSRVFHNVVALVPYTLGSVPTMITGLSFLDHEVLYPENRLADEAVTMAEMLADTGYRTAAFSSTPNNSRSKGFDQGYAVFVEDWADGERHLPIDPHRLVGHAVDWLEQTSQDRPFHLLIHMVPPHEPYHPGPEFDRFSDPDYRGPVDGDLPWNMAFNNAATVADDADRRHLIDLYDGNLLRADDATGQLLRALQARSDWGRTVVLVTSDHGEALTEHGTIGHNATVYDEMLRVPFILRIPGETERTDDHRFAALTDLAPTLLAAAGFEVIPDHDARNLLDPDHGPPRALVVRTSHKYPTWGVRTDRHKLIHRGSAGSELFDLEQDPGETMSVIDRDRLLAAALRQVLSDRRRLEPLLQAGDAVALGAEDRRMLEALGYVD
jgi:arylsulfatase A-like enzyme